MKIKLMLAAAVIILNACQSARQEGINSALEKLVENQTGQEIDLASVESHYEQKTEASYFFDGKSQLENDGFSSSIIALKEGNLLNISFQLVNETGHSLMGVFSNIPPNFKLPLSAQFVKSDSELQGKPKATLVYLKVSETGMESTPMPFEGEMTIAKLNESIAEFEINGKGGKPENVENPETWKALKGKVKITSPVIQSIGISKEDFLK